MTESIRYRIHEKGYIIGGLHHRGMQLRDAERAAGRGVLRDYLTTGAVQIKKKGKRVAYVVKRLSYPFGHPHELGIARLQHFLSDINGQYMAPDEFERRFVVVYENLVDTYKFPG